RDLKPANVLLAACGLGGDSPNERQPAVNPKIADFGLAKVVRADGGFTRTGVVMGTPGFMAPEQAAGDPRRIGPAADTYALGAILLQLLTGRPPFQAVTPVETVLQLLEHEPPSVSKFRPDVPRDLAVICTRCLRKEPHERYSTCDALAEDLKRFLNGE